MALYTYGIDYSNAWRIYDKDDEEEEFMIYECENGGNYNERNRLLKSSDLKFQMPYSQTFINQLF